MTRSEKSVHDLIELQQIARIALNTNDNDTVKAMAWLDRQEVTPKVVEALSWWNANRNWDGRVMYELVGKMEVK